MQGLGVQGLRGQVSLRRRIHRSKEIGERPNNYTNTCNAKILSQVFRWMDDNRQKIFG
jgi:hypothetical protein